MAATETFICNQALARLGGERIMSMDDASKAARFCKLFYAQTRDEVLRSHHWNFAVKRANLARLADGPLFGWAHQYQLPTDFIRLVQLNGYGENEATRHCEIEGGVLLTNEEEAQVRYVRRVDDTNLFDPLFIEALAVKLASKLAQPLTGNRSLPVEILTEYERVTAPLARRVDAQEERRRRKQPWVDSAFVRARGANFPTTGLGSSSGPGGDSGADDRSFDFLANVFHYGAKGDGTDDYPAIAAALNAVVNNGSGTVYFPGGRSYHVRSEGVHGIHIDRKSNIKIEMGEGAVLVMDNMEGGVGVSHGIYVQGPCENIRLENVHVKYATMAVYRQTWAPFYFLGANVGTGDQDTGGWYRGEPDGERPDLIAAGSVRNVRMIGCRSENSPSVFVGVVNVDDILIEDFQGHTSWADGIYLRSMRRGRIDNANMTYVGDDAISCGAEESNIELANIDNDFHCEGTVISNVSVRYNYPVDDGHAGSIVILGCRDVTWTNFVAQDRYRAIKIEAGTETTGRYDRLHLNFLASKNVVINGVTGHHLYQALWFLQKEFVSVEETDPKWWKYENMLLTNIGFHDCFVGVSSSGISGGQPNPSTPPPEGPAIVAGVTIDGLKARGVQSRFSNAGILMDSKFLNIDIDHDLTFQGFCPFRGNIEDPRYPENHCEFDNIRAKKLVFVGLKRCKIGRASSYNADDTGLSITTCADIDCDQLNGINSNRLGAEFANNVAWDLYCRRITAAHVYCYQDEMPIPDCFSINNGEDNWAELVTIKTSLDTFIQKTSDSRLNRERQPQIGTIRWLHSDSETPKWRERKAMRGEIATNGNVDIDLFPNGDTTHMQYGFPLTADRTVTLWHDAVKQGDLLSVQRLPEATGDFSISVVGSERPRAPGNILVKNLTAEGQFAATGFAHVPFSQVTIDATIVNNTEEAIAAPYLHVFTALADSDEDFANIAEDSNPIGDIAPGESGSISFPVDISLVRGNGGVPTAGSPVTYILPNGTLKVELRDADDVEIGTATLVISSLGSLQKVASGADSITGVSERTVEPVYYGDEAGDAAVYPVYETQAGQTGTWDFMFDDDEWRLVRRAVDFKGGGLGDGTDYVTMVVTGDAAINATNLQLAYNQAKALTPHGTAKSATNRAVLFIPPCHIDLGTNGQFALDTQFVDVAGLSGDPAHVLITGAHTGTDSGVIRHYANNTRLENVTVTITGTGGGSGGARPAAYFPNSGLDEVVLKNCVFRVDGGNNYTMRHAVKYEGRYERVVADGSAFGVGGGDGEASGVFIECEVAGDAWPGKFMGRMERCRWTTTDSGEDCLTVSSGAEIYFSTLTAAGSGKSVNAGSPTDVVISHCALSNGVGSNITNTLPD